MRKQKKRARMSPKKRSPEEIALLDRAKAVLMERNHMSEAEAHRYLEKTAMDLGMKVRQVAIRVIHRYD